MTVECPSCGQSVDIPSFPGWCPACNRRITTIVPPLISKRAQLSSRSLADPATEPAVEQPLPYVEPARRRQRDWIKWSIIAGTVILFFIGAFLLVDFIAKKARDVIALRNATTASTTQAVPAPPPQQSPPPAPAPAEPQPPIDSAPALTPAPPPALVFAASLQPKRYEEPPGAVTDKAIHDAILKGVTYLIEQANDATFQPLPGENPDHAEGRYALCVLALLHAGQATLDPRLNMSGELMPAVIDRMKKLPLNEGAATYARAIRALALSVHDRRVDRATFNGDLDWLLKASTSGAYYYYMPKTKEERELKRYDNSNSQYGVLGVWAAADVGLGVPTSYWEEIEKHWTDQQLPSGAWGYNLINEPRLAMTAGGVTSLFVAGDMLAPTRAAEGLDRAPFKPALQKALDWLSTGDNGVTLGGSHEGYALYGLERAGLASGFKRFGKHDWYRVLTAQILEQQKEDGSWLGGDGIRVETAFRILFLARGRHPIMMNKLRFEGAWANRPRDVAKLTDFVYDTIERPVNWQVVNLSEGWMDWMDAPIVYLASHAPLALTDENLKQLRLYVENGGLLFTHADADAKEFNDFADGLAKSLFPQLEMRDLPPSHDVSSMVYKLSGENLPQLRGVSNGSRVLMIHSTTDLAARWQNRNPKTMPIPFQLGANVFVYATGKQTLRNRLDTSLVPETPGKPLGAFTVAHLKHAGAWNPEPAAWDRMARWFRRETSIALNVVPTEIAKLRRDATPFAHLTTTAAWKPSEAELQVIRTFVRDGGMLLLDPCGGSRDLALALQRDVAQAAFPDVSPRDVTAKDPFLAGSGAGMEDLTKPAARVYAVELLENNLPPMQVIGVGKGWIIVSKLDLISGLLGTSTWGILGYDALYAQSLMKNLILFACNGRTMIGPTTSPATAPTPDTAG